MPNKYWVYLADGTTKVLHSVGNAINDIPVVGHRVIPENIQDNYKAEDAKEVAKAEKETDNAE